MNPKTNREWAYIAFTEEPLDTRFARQFGFNHFNSNILFHNGRVQVIDWRNGSVTGRRATRPSLHWPVQGSIRDMMDRFNDSWSHELPPSWLDFQKIGRIHRPFIPQPPPIYFYDTPFKRSPEAEERMRNFFIDKMKTPPKTRFTILEGEVSWTALDRANVAIDALISKHEADILSDKVISDPFRYLYNEPGGAALKYPSDTHVRLRPAKRTMVNILKLVDTDVPKRIHNPRHGSAAYHARIQKKWMYRFGMVKRSTPAVMTMSDAMTSALRKLTIKKGIK